MPPPGQLLRCLPSLPGCTSLQLAVELDVTRCRKGVSSCCNQAREQGSLALPDTVLLGCRFVIDHNKEQGSLAERTYQNLV